MTWRTGDTGRTRAGHRYRIIADDAKGTRGPLVALLEVAEEELVKRYQAHGTDVGAYQAYDLGPPAARAA